MVDEAPGLARALVQAGARRLCAAGMEHGRQEAEWLLGRLLGLRPLDVYLRESAVPAEAVAQFFAEIEARAAGIPLQYLLGETEFFGLTFRVEPGVFIPRPETEAVVEEALRRFRALEAKRGRALRLLDLGTGSGCIAVALARALPACLVVGVELSWQALCVARTNVGRQHCSDRVLLIQGRWAGALRGPFDGVISNPPYVPSAQVDQLPLDVRQEPRLSLDGGPNGLRELTELLRELPRLVSPGGCVVLECGEEQGGALQRVLAGASWVAAVWPIVDLAARPRGLVITRSDTGERG